MENQFGIIEEFDENWYFCSPNPQGNSFKYSSNNKEDSYKLSSREPPKDFFLYRNPLIVDENQDLRSKENAREIANTLEGRIVEADYESELLENGDFNKLAFLHLMLRSGGKKINERGTHQDFNLPRGYILGTTPFETVDSSYLPFWERKETDLLNNQEAIKLHSDILLFSFQGNLSKKSGYKVWDDENKTSIKGILPICYDYLLMK